VAGSRSCCLNSRIGSVRFYVAGRVQRAAVGRSTVGAAAGICRRLRLGLSVRRSGRSLGWAGFGACSAPGIEPGLCCGRLWPRPRAEAAGCRRGRL
jgi:hypothetical protein